MATVKVILKTEKKTEKGLIPIYLRIIKNRKVRFLSLGYSVLEKDWDEKKQKVKKSDPLYSQKNAYIASKIFEAEGTCLEMETGSKVITSRQIKHKIMGSEPPSFIKFVDDKLKREEQTINYGTYRKNKAIISKLKAFVSERDLLFDDMTVTWLKEYEHYLATDKDLHNSVNTIQSNLKIIRKYFNEAVAEGVVLYESNPFLQFKIKSEPTERLFLTEEEISLIEALELKQSSVIDNVRNIFIFACYAAGLRISDLLQLKWNNFDGTHINLVIQKTGQMHSVKLPSKALSILGSYKAVDSEPNHFIFPILDNKADYSNPKELFRAIATGTALCNNYLSKIAKLAELKKEISMHVSRHSWATRALRKGVRIEYVSKLLGHSSIKTTQVYARIVNADLDQAMDVFEEPLPKFD